MSTGAAPTKAQTLENGSPLSCDLYAILNLQKHATIADIKSAFRRLVKKYHPDKGHGYHQDYFVAVQRAFKVLSDPLLRAKYDRDGLADVSNGELDDFLVYFKNIFAKTPGTTPAIDHTFCMNKDFGPGDKGKYVKMKYWRQEIQTKNAECRICYGYGLHVTSSGGSSWRNVCQCTKVEMIPDEIKLLVPCEETTVIVDGRGDEYPGYSRGPLRAIFRFKDAPEDEPAVASHGLISIAASMVGISGIQSNTNGDVSRKKLRGASVGTAELHTQKGSKACLTAATQNGSQLRKPCTTATTCNANQLRKDPVAQTTTITTCNANQHRGQPATCVPNMTNMTIKCGGGLLPDVRSKHSGNRIALDHKGLPVHWGDEGDVTDMKHKPSGNQAAYDDRGNATVYDHKGLPVHW